MSHALLGVAHRTLPCGTPVAVFFAGKAITVPVVDRGPFANGARYDLTSAVAQAVGMTETSTIGVVPQRGAFDGSRRPRPPRRPSRARAAWRRRRSAVSALRAASGALRSAYCRIEGRKWRRSVRGRLGERTASADQATRRQRIAQAAAAEFLRASRAFRNTSPARLEGVGSLTR